MKLTYSRPDTIYYSSPPPHLADQNVFPPFFISCF